MPRGAVVKPSAIDLRFVAICGVSAIEVAPALFWMDVWFLRLTSRDL